MTSFYEGCQYAIQLIFIFCGIEPILGICEVLNKDLWSTGHCGGFSSFRRHCDIFCSRPKEYPAAVIERPDRLSLSTGGFILLYLFSFLNVYDGMLHRNSTVTECFLCRTFECNFFLPCRKICKTNYVVLFK